MYLRVMRHQRRQRDKKGWQAAGRLLAGRLSRRGAQGTNTPLAYCITSNLRSTGHKLRTYSSNTDYNRRLALTLPYVAAESSTFPLITAVWNRERVVSKYDDERIACLGLGGNPALTLSLFDVVCRQFVRATHTYGSRVPLCEGED